MIRRRTFIKGVSTGVAGTAILASTASGQSDESALIVDDFDGDPGWPGENDLGEWTDAGELAEEASVVDIGQGLSYGPALRLAYDGGGWYGTNVGRDVSAYDRLELVVRGADGGEEDDVRLEVGGVEDALPELTDDEIGTSVSTVAVDLEAAGVDRTAVDDVWLTFGPEASGRIDLVEVRFAGGDDDGGDGPPAVGGNDERPTDPDGDGEYEDINGNGEVDYDDVVTYFDNMESDAMTDNAEYYDYNGNGEVDYADLVDLFGEV
ncbi:hypothetical protein [Halomicrobium salinisoli]|uniref:hypothetical protein n=1 Tax=Halomicrobium salinisoli TaxID=2878391 RepID=UPI001CEFDA5D|nr:hypothetical protein [Halomicrobium salinisoli]